MSRWRTSRRSALPTAVLALWCAGMAQGAVDAVFEVRTAPGEMDSVLNVNEQLKLEVWLTLKGAPIPNVTGASFFLDLDGAENGAITFDNNWVTDAAFSFGGFVTGAVNTPVTGEFAAGVLANPAVGVPFIDNSPRRIGAFSVTALNPGAAVTAEYVFGDRGPTGPWRVNFLGAAATANLLNGPALPISVVPEPGVPLLVALSGWAAAARRRR